MLPRTDEVKDQGKEQIQRDILVMVVAEIQQRGHTIVCTYKRHDRPNPQDLFLAADRLLKRIGQQIRLPYPCVVRFSDAAEHYDDADVQVGFTAGLECTRVSYG